MDETTQKHDLLNTAGQLYIQRHSSYNSIYKTSISPSQTESLHREGSRIYNLTLSCGAVGRGETIFSNNAAPAESANFQWKSILPRRFDQHKLFLKDLIFFKDICIFFFSV